MRVGETVRLTGKSLHGRNRIRENGDLWTVSKVEKLDGVEKALLASLETDDVRWVAIEDDKNFTMEMKEA